MLLRVVLGKDEFDGLTFVLGKILLENIGYKACRDEDLNFINGAGKAALYHFINCCSDNALSFKSLFQDLAGLLGADSSGGKLYQTVAVIDLNDLSFDFIANLYKLM